MKVLPGLIAIVLAVQLTCQSVSAGTIVIERDPNGTLSSIRGEAFSPKIGNLMGTKLKMLVDGQSVIVQDVDKDGQPQTVLQGVIMNAKITDTDKQPTLRGYCYFASGSHIAEVTRGDGTNITNTSTGSGSTNSPAAADCFPADLIQTLDGKKVIGRIKSIENGNIDIERSGKIEKVPIAQVRSIWSNRAYFLTAFVFPEPASASGNVIDIREGRVLRFEFETTLDEMMTEAGKNRMEERLKTAGGYTRKQRLAIIGGSLFITALAIAIPICLAVPLAGKNKPETAPASAHSFESINR